MAALNPRGVVAVLTFPAGGFVCSVSDFQQDGYGGCSLQEAQTIRVKRLLARAAIDTLCSEYVSKAINNYRCEEIVSEMVRQGFRLAIVPIGYDGES